MSNGDERTTAARDRDFDRLVAEQRDRSIALAWRLLGGDRAAAEDVVQEALLKALRTWSFHGVPPQPDAWLFTAARNLALDVLFTRDPRWVGVSVGRDVVP